MMSNLPLSKQLREKHDVLLRQGKQLLNRLPQLQNPPQHLVLLLLHHLKLHLLEAI